MTDLIQNVQEVCKKWETRSAPYLRARNQRGGSFSRGHNDHGDQFGFSSQSSNQPWERRGKQRSRFPYVSLPKYHNLAHFKMAPTVIPENKPRPFMGSCCPKCLPKSRAAIVDHSIFTLSVCNILHIPLISKKVFSNLKEFVQTLDILKREPSQCFPDVSENVLKCERVVAAVHSASSKEEDSNANNQISQTSVSSDQLVRVRILMNRMKSTMSILFLRFSGWLLHSVLNNILDGIIVHRGHMEILKIISQDDVPIIYLPVHRSHLDYILVSFILYMYNLKVPLVAAGDNLHIPVFGYILRCLGAFFIRRRLDSEHSGKDYVYRALLQSYVTECLKAGHSLEFFIEGGRSRSGKAQMPKSGLLSIVVNSVLEGSIEDAYIAPVSISYEKLMEGNFVSEQLGQLKKKESFVSAICSIWRACHSNFGYIRLDFGQPFSIKEFLQSSKQISSLMARDLNVETPPSSSESDVSGSAYGDDFKIAKKSLRTVIKDLAQHVIYDSICSTSLMSTHLLAFLLMTQYRKGATQQQLQFSFDWLRGELSKKKRDVGFTGESVAVIKRAVAFLGAELITTETIEMEWTSSDLENNNIKVLVYKPVVKLPYVLELQYYANSVVPAFLLDSVVVNAIYALVDIEICHFLLCDSKLHVMRDKLIDKAMVLCDLLQFEFLMGPPCADIASNLNDVIEDLLVKEYLHLTGVLRASGQRSNRSYALSFETSDEDDELYSNREQELKIDLREESINHLEFLRSILSPCIESYWLAATTLLKLIHEVKEENLFIREMQMTAREKLHKGLLAFEESFSAETFKNSLKLFEHLHIIEHYNQDDVKIIYLQENYDNAERIGDVISKFEEFRK